jgi:serine/threonine protein kinase
MIRDPAPLNEGFILGSRWSVESLLGRGGFGITYAAREISTQRLAAIKELAPQAIVRLPDGRLDWTMVGPAAAHRMRHQFQQEGKLLQRLAGEGVPAVYSVFAENDTAYIVMERLAHAKTISELIDAAGPRPWEEVEELILQTLASVAALHERGVLHLDIKPSNILVGDNRVCLIDLGSARQWHTDLTRTHTVQFTPGYAAPEQFSERARRTPATDLYGLAASAWHMLTGESVPSAPERAAGTVLPLLADVKPETPERFALAIERALALRIEERPASAGEFRDLILPEEEPEEVDRSIEKLDEIRLRLRQFKYRPQGCPACGEVLERPKPLKACVCPVCREGRIQSRRLEEHTCPGCRTGLLSQVDAEPPRIWCPSCHVSQISVTRKPPLVGKITSAACKCGWSSAASNEGLVQNDKAMPWEEAALLAGRTPAVMRCDVCSLIFDVLEDGRYRRVGNSLFAGGWDTLHPDEWARIAAGLEPDAGNAVCSHCRSDYFVDGDTITLLKDGGDDRFGFAAAHLGRLLTIESARWLAVGKESGEDGYVCRNCGTELDRDGDKMILARSTHPILRRHVGESKRNLDWHRLAQELPEEGTEKLLDLEIQDALAEEFTAGRIQFDPRHPEFIWKGDAFLNEKKTKVIIRQKSIELGGPVRKTHIEARDIDRIQSRADKLILDLGDGSRIAFEVAPAHLTFRLRSGDQELLLDAKDLARCLARAWPWVSLSFPNRSVPERN